MPAKYVNQKQTKCAKNGGVPKTAYGQEDGQSSVLN